MPDIEAVLFDVGGVIVRMDDIAKLGPFGAVADADGIRARWLNCAIVQAHERGEIDAQEFARRMIATHHMACAPEDFLARFQAWPREVFPGVAELLAAIDPSVKIACLSNTSAVHWQTQIARDDLFRLFDRQFLSFELGALKPDPEIYRRVAAALAVPPQRMIFFDDHQANVDGARQAGLIAFRVDGPGPARRILEDYGLLESTSAGSSQVAPS